MIARLFARPVAWLIAALVVALALWAIYARLTASPKAEARLGRNQAGAAQASGHDAVETVGGQHAAEAAVDQVTRENEDAIRTAPGADAPVDPAVRGAALRSLCRRAAYRRDPQCLQLAAPD